MDTTSRSALEAMLSDFAHAQVVQLAGSSSIPLYHQLYRVLLKFIQKKRLKSGTRFPSEEVLTSCFNVSRPTVNKAVQELIDQGWLVRERGRGTFITQTPSIELTLLQNSLSLTDQFSPSSQLTSRLVSHKHLPATPEVSCALHVDLEDEVLYLRRLRSVNDYPIMVCDSYLPAGRFPHLGEEPFIRESLYATLAERYGCSIMKSDRYVEATEIVEQDVAELLGTSLFSPILLLKGLTFAKKNAVIEYMVSYVKEGVSFKSIVSRAPDASTVTKPTELRQGG